jgi:putative chitinase
MIILTADLFKKAMPNVTKANIERFQFALQTVTIHFEITTAFRMAAFLGQGGHECADFTALTENLNYSADALLRVFPKYFDAIRAKAYARKPEAIANLVYANRMGNGDVASGDGWKHRGMGMIQTTGKANQEEVARAGKFPVEDLSKDPYAIVFSAGYYWNKHKLNNIADIGTLESYAKISRIINMGPGAANKIGAIPHGMTDRNNRYRVALKALGV